MAEQYWKSVLGVETYKWKWYFERFMYKLFGLTLPKLKSQQGYWEGRGTVYMDEILSSGYLEREVFFQNMLIDKLGQMDFDSFFEAGCGFGWNIRRVKEEFPQARVGGVDFSSTQIANANDYIGDLDITTAQGDICRMPLADNAFDIGFSLGVFMNIHPDKIGDAAKEMVRVCRKKIIHIEYDSENTTQQLREKRVTKRNIVSHNYRQIYESLGRKVVEFRTYKDFGADFDRHIRKVDSNLDRWEGFEGPEKYVLIIVEI
ncbi:MAG: class I SAM-dependent methyltransferase [Planctomycetes bacterium]|nr:class I SAM-dependent methyltransferase [Planctomycetota bacterium]